MKIQSRRKMWLPMSFVVRGNVKINFNLYTYFGYKGDRWSKDFPSTKYNTVCKILGEKGSANIILRRKRMMKMSIKSKMFVPILCKVGHNSYQIAMFFRFHWIHLKD